MDVRRLFCALLMVAVSVPACAAASTPLPKGELQPVVQIPKGHFVTLNFHAVLSRKKLAKDPDPYAISTNRLALWFDWMKQHNWHPVSFSRIEQAHNGGPPLPPNPVLLTVDDGLENIYTNIFPLLRAYNYPALYALETGWIERVHGGRMIDYRGMKLPPRMRNDMKEADQSANLREPGKVFYNGVELGPSGFVSWAQVREMCDSGLIELATHTDDLHHGIWANPQGNSEPAAITHLYNRDTKSYETDEQYRTRVRDDLKLSVQLIKKHTGITTHIAVWPYGAVNHEVEDIAHSVGLSTSMGLADRHISSVKHLKSLGRFLITGNVVPADIERQVAAAMAPNREVYRAVQVDMDYVYDPDPAQMHRNVDKLLDRIKALKVRAVYLQAFADPDGNGTASALYFPNSYLPMRADLFNRLAWQLNNRGGVLVYAWLPLLAFDLPDKALDRQLAVKVMKGGKRVPSTHADHRLSPFLPRSQRIITGIYRELARDATSIGGILISDDAYLAADEDASSCEPQARWPGTHKKIKHCHLSARQKTNALIDFSQQVVKPLRHYQNWSNRFDVVRNIYARVVMDPSAENRFAQALGPFLKNYDEVALMAMPYLDGTHMAPDKWLQRLVSKVAAYPQGLNKTVFELQAKNWDTDKPIKGTTLERWMHELIGLGALNFGYYPDDFIHNRPAFNPTYRGISLEDFPHGGYPRKKAAK